MDRPLLEQLICPLTQGKLEYDKERQVLISRGAKLVYPIREGIPILLEGEATPLEEWQNQVSAQTPLLEPDLQPAPETDPQ